MCIKISAKQSSDDTAAVQTYKNTLACEKPAVVSSSENVQVHYHWLPCVLNFHLQCAAPDSAVPTRTCTYMRVNNSQDVPKQSIDRIKCTLWWNNNSNATLWSKNVYRQKHKEEPFKAKNQHFNKSNNSNFKNVHWKYLILQYILIQKYVCTEFQTRRETRPRVRDIAGFCRKPFRSIAAAA